MFNEFLCLCVELSLAPRLSTKLIKVPVPLLRKLCISIITYLDDMLLMAGSREELLIARDTLIFLLQHLKFLINSQKSILDPTSTLEFLTVLGESQNMTLSLPQEKVEKIKNQCKEFLKESLVTARELSKLIGRLSSTALAVLPAPLQYRTLQHEQIQGMISKSSLEGQLSLSKQVRGELHWWIQNISLYNREVRNFSPSRNK